MQAPNGSKYVDLLIIDDDLALDPAGLPQLSWDRGSIAQDIKHAIREQGYLVLMIGERSNDRRRLLIQKVRLIVEDDVRIVPGTVIITLLTPNFENNQGTWAVVADSYEFGPVNLDISLAVAA